MPRKVDIGITRLAWVPGEDGIADVSSPELSELNAVGVLDLSCLMVTTYEVRADASDTTNERAVCETANVVTPTVQNYMGNMILFRDYNDDVSSFTASDALSVFAYGAIGYFVRRLGLSKDTAWAEGQQVEVYKFMVDSPQIQGGTGQGYLKATVPLLQQGSFDLAAIVGGS